MVSGSCLGARNKKPENQETEVLDGSSDSRLALRSPNAAQETGLHSNSRLDARARRWRKCNHLQLRKRNSAAPAGLQGC